MLIDLQVHSTYSDGYLSPTEVVKFLAGRGVKIAALTDHNTVGGVEEFQRACKAYKIKPIIGIELYTKLGHKRINLLWFNFDHNDPQLHEILRNSQARRRSKIRKILQDLIANGFKINIDKILDKYNHYISINHLIDDILSVPANRERVKKDLKNDKPREEEILSHYFYKSKITKFENSYIDIKRIVKLRKKIGGQLIFNHPGKYNQLKRAVVAEMKSLGIDGIEVLSPHHSVGAVMYAQFMAKEFNLIMTGGSDFHRFENKKNQGLVCSWQYYKIDSEYLKGVNKIID